MSSLIGAYASVLMPHRDTRILGNESMRGRDGVATPPDPLSLSLSSAIYRAISLLERAGTSARSSQRRRAAHGPGRLDP